MSNDMSAVYRDPAAQRVETLMQHCRERCERVLATLLDDYAAPDERLAAAMRYGVLGGGKRLRPVLVYAAGRALGAEEAMLDHPAAAVELIHAYSLVHDDLPAMDNDELRRGQPTCHRAFDEATALLAGDALQTLAFEALAVDNPPRVGALVTTLAHAAGRAGMAGGQALDLDAVGRKLSVAELKTVHRHKTGALIRAAVRLGGLTAVAADDPRLDALDRYAAAIGLAFQIQDDILDVTGNTAVIGKTQGADAARHKPTYPALLGLDEAARQAHALVDEACAALQGLEAQPLIDLARYMIERNH